MPAEKKLLTGDAEDGAPGEEELVIVETPIVDEPGSSASNDGDDDDGDDGDEHRESDDRVIKRSEGDHADETPEARKARRMQEKQDRRERREQAIRRNKLEMEFLRKRNDDLEKRLDGVVTQVQQSTIATIDAELLKAQREFKMAEEVMAKAAAANNGEDLVKALGFRDAARDRFNSLIQQKQTQTEAKPAAQDRSAAPPAVIEHARKFVAENPWYDAKGGNVDSQIVQVIDNALASEGYDPQSPEYWVELKRRAARRLPERFQRAQPRQRPAAADDGDDEPAPAPARREVRGGPAVGSGRGDAPQGGGKQFYLSPERKAALVEAGVWDDPVLRAKYVKKYAEYDRAAKASKS